MTHLLEKAFAEASGLPEHEQDAIAELLLPELASEKRWDELFDKSQNALADLAGEALADYRAGKTKAL